MFVMKFVMKFVKIVLAKTGELCLNNIRCRKLSRPVGMADEVDSKSIGSDTVRVQVPRPALLGRGESLNLQLG